ncbi:MAG: hypothetical protein NT140_05770, partial [Deltaproteobacteria bacterium]|nr:hypothetical protein [Deltaproteobacteria bacterium]
AQTGNIVGAEFKDGSIIYGRVIKMNVYDIHIETKDGKIISRNFDEVARFLKDIDVDAKLESKTPIVDKVSRDARHAWEIGPEISIIEYKEPDVMSQKGTMYGIGAAYIYHNGVMIKVAGRYSYGQVDYQNSGTLDNIDDSIFEIRTLGGYDFKIGSSFTMTPFIGFGYRYLKDDGSGRITSTGAGGYLRESNYYYSPIGIEAVNVFDKGWSAGVILEYDYFWQGMQKSYESSFLAGLNDIENHQNSGYGARGSIIIKKQTDRVFYFIEPFIRYWNIADSDVQPLTFNGAPTGLGIYEPKNNSTEIGVRFMIGF